MNNWIQENSFGVQINLIVQPGAKRSELIGVHDGCLKIRVQAPPVDGAANEAIVNWFAKQIGVKKRDVKLNKGLSSRIKALIIQGVSCEEVMAVLKVGK